MSAPFAFADSPAELGTLRTHVAVVPVGLSSRESLFGALRRSLQLPSYFGGNWDALDECLRDLSWLEEQRVLLYHEALPQLDDDALRTYLEVLRDAVLDWREDDDDELVVGFPLGEANRIAALIA